MSEVYREKGGIVEILNTLDPGTPIETLICNGKEYNDIYFSNYNKEKNLAYFFNDNVAIVVEASGIQSIVL
ncbi:hypothetical protein [Evansella halocellulosilytica]|uniref:hypothetical protein n=1 Tax=Evansella halocellulosilytica TaxID=2011013 RepID=UPI000BB8234D|nr:hypothetical protein [Evansella halocellulosilytica]